MRLLRAAFLCAACTAPGISPAAPIALGNIDTVAGGGIADGAQATAAILSNPQGVAFDAAGNLLIGDAGHARVRKVASDGTISTVFAGDTAQIMAFGQLFQYGTASCPGDMVSDAAGNILVADPCSHVVRRIDASGHASIFAGRGMPTLADLSAPNGDGGPATAALLVSPTHIAIDAAGNVFVTEPTQWRVRKIAPDGVISTLFGPPVPVFSVGTNASNVIGAGPLAADGSGGVYTYASDVNNTWGSTSGYPANRLVHIDAAGVRTVVAGNGIRDNSGDGALAINAGIGNVLGIVREASGDLVLSFADRMRRIHVASGLIDTIANVGAGALVASGNAFVATQGNFVVRITPPAAQVTVLAGAATPPALGDGGSALNAVLSAPAAMARTRDGILYVADTAHHRIRKVDAAGVITTFAGTGTAGFSGDGGSAALAQLSSPAGIALDAAGNVFIADRGNNRIRRIDTSGRITTIAGTGVAGFSGDGGPATRAQLSMPTGLRFDASGALLVADYDNERVRRIAPDGTISTVAGGGIYRSLSPTSAASLFLEPQGIAADASGNLAVANTDPQGGGVLWAVDASGVATMLVNRGMSVIPSPVYLNLVSIMSARDVAAGPGGTFYVSDPATHRVFAAGSNGSTLSGFTTLAGATPCSGAPQACVPGWGGDGHAAVGAGLNAPQGLFWDEASGNLYVADTGNDRIRAIRLAQPKPLPFAFAARSGVAPATTVVSETITPRGFSEPTTLYTVAAALPAGSSDGTGIGGDPGTGGSLTTGAPGSPGPAQTVVAEYSIGCTGSFTSVPGTLNPGESVCVRVTASSLNNARTTATLTVGDVGTGTRADFVVTTAPGPGSSSIDTSSVDFGAQPLFTPGQSRTVTVTNTGTNDITLNGIDAPPGISVAHNCATLAAGATCTVTISFYPAAAGTVSGNVALLFSSGTQTIAVTAAAEKSLATHYYQAILGRDPDSGGKAFWEGEAARAARLGINPNEAWYAMAAAFFASPEYAAFHRDDDGFLADVYNAFLNRAPDAGGLAFWKGQLASGITRDMVIASFTFSDEFTAFTRRIFGATAVRAEIDMVSDLYRGFMHRLPDDAGFASWVGQLRAAQCLPPGQQSAAVKQAVNDLAQAFVASAEYRDRHATDAQFLADLYNAIQRRGGDTQGVAYWLGRLASGTDTRESVLASTIFGSQEFQDRVSRVAAQGCAR